MTDLSHSIWVSSRRQDNLIFVSNKCISNFGFILKSNATSSRKSHCFISHCHHMWAVFARRVKGMKAQDSVPACFLHFAYLNIYATRNSVWTTDGSIHVQYFTSAAYLHLKGGKIESIFKFKILDWIPLIRKNIVYTINLHFRTLHVGQSP